METSIPSPHGGPELMGKGSRRPIWPSRAAAFLAWIVVGMREGAGYRTGQRGSGPLEAFLASSFIAGMLRRMV